MASYATSQVHHHVTTTITITQRNRMVKMISGAKQKAAIVAVFSFVCTSITCICSCSGGENGTGTPWSINDDSTYVENEIQPDTMEGKEVTHECATLSYDLDEIIFKLQSVKSPYMLIRIRQQYPSLIENIEQEAKNLPADENAAIEDKIARINELYRQVCRAYEVEAQSVITNLQRCAKELEQVKDSASLANFLSYRFATVSTLESAHLCVDQRSPRIKEIRQLAHKLDGMVKAKMEKYQK